MTNRLNAKKAVNLIFKYKPRGNFFSYGSFYQMLMYGPLVIVKFPCHNLFLGKQYEIRGVTESQIIK